MKAKDIRIVYMGTPDFAVAPLKELVENNYNVVGVITAADKPAGRGKNLRESAVKIYAKEQGLTVLQPDKLKEADFNNNLADLKPDLQIVVAFRMLPEIVWQLPRLGTFNLHASLLPQYRGAAPINWAIINGEKKTGITTFLIDKKIDTGRIILQNEIEIAKDDNVENLHDKMMQKGAKLIAETVNLIAKGDVVTKQQKELVAGDLILKPAPKIFKNDCKINWHIEGKKTYNFIRGLSPYPAAWTVFQSMNSDKILTVKIFDTEWVTSEHELLTTDIDSDKKTYFNVAVPGGFISIKSIQLEGKKRMKIADFLRGFDIEAYLIDPKPSCLL
ncbi:MAG: methionyl-tRNA formyltransferase [Bacteroidetes bacterium 4572_117]|nr:MAG: methionyl-tRNA formyltransferase [Bacteroidetes bacterium 4572_117]